MDKKFDLSVIFRVVNKATEPLKRSSKSFKELGETVDRVGKKMKSVGKDLSLKLTLPIVSFGTLSLKASMDFNEAMANVATLIPKNIERVKQLKGSVQDMGIRMGQSTSIVAEGLYQVISAFGDLGKQTTGILEISAKAARAGRATVKESVDLISAVIKGYGDVTEKASKKAADLAFQTVKLGQTTFPELASAVGRVIPWAAQLNVSQEQLFAGFATLTGVTGTASEVSTQLAGALRALVKPSDMMTKALTYMGYKSGKELLADKGLVGAFKTLFELTKGNEQVMTEMFGRTEPLVAIFSLLGGQADTYNKKLEAMEDAAGAMNDAFNEQTKGINKAGFAWDQFKTKLSVLVQKVGDSLSPAFESFLKVLGPLVDWFTKLDPKIKKFLGIIAGIAAVIGPLLVGLAIISATLTALAASPVAGAIAAIAGAVVILTSAIGGLVKVFTKPVQKIFEGLGWLATSGFSKLGVGVDEETIRRNIEATRIKAGIAAGTIPVGESRSQTDINIKVSSDSGSTATVEKIKKRTGDANVAIATEGYLGGMAF